MAAAIGDVPPLKRNKSQDFIPPYMSELLVVLLGNSWSERSSVGNLLLGETKFNSEEEPDFVTVRGQLKEKEIVLINTPDLLNPNISEDKLRKHVELCVRLSDPGPHVFLLVLQPEDFTEEHRLRICRVLELFSDQSFDRSLVLISASREESSFENFMKNRSFRDLITECRYRYLFQKNLERSELLIHLSQIVKENREDLSSDGSEDGGLTMKPTFEQIKPFLNLVMCGGREEENTSAAETILGQTELHSAFSSSGKTQGEVCGRRQQEAEAAIQKEMKKILKEKEEGMKKKIEERERKHEEEIKAMKTRIEEQRTKIEEERKLRVKLLDEMKENINKRKKEQEVREEEKRKKEAEEEEYRQRVKMELELLDKQIQSEQEEKKNVDRKLEETRDEMRKKQEAWEEEQRKWWKKQKQEDEERKQEEKRKIEELKEEFKQKQDENEKKRKEEDQIMRKEEERKHKELEESYKTELINMKKMYEEEARERAEEFNDFKVKQMEICEALNELYDEQIENKDQRYDLLNQRYKLLNQRYDLLKLKYELLNQRYDLQNQRYDRLIQMHDRLTTSEREKHLHQLQVFALLVSWKKENLRKISDLLDKQEKELKNVKNDTEKKNLQEKHEEEISDFFYKLLTEDGGGWFDAFKNLFSFGK